MQSQGQVGSTSSVCTLTVGYGAAGSSAPWMTGDAQLAVGGSSVTLTGTKYCGPWGALSATAPAAQYSCNGTVEDNAAFLMPSACTLTGFTAAFDAAYTSSQIETYTVIKRVGTSDTTTDLAGVLSGAGVVRVGDSCVPGSTCAAANSLAAGDRVVVRSVYTGSGAPTPAPSPRYHRVAFSCDGSGQVVSGVLQNITSTLAYCAQNCLGTSASVAVRAPKDATAKHLRLYVDTNGTDQAVGTLYVGNAANALSPTALTCTATVSSGATCDSGTTTVSINAGQFYAIGLSSPSLNNGSKWVHYAMELGIGPAPTNTVGPTPTPVPLGRTNFGLLEDSNDAGSINCSPITTGAGGMVAASITVGINDVSGTFNKWRGAIYSNLTGPTTLLAETAEGTLSASTPPQWNTLAFTSPPTLSASTKYWACYQTNLTAAPSLNNLMRDNGVANSAYWTTSAFTYGAYPQPFPAKTGGTAMFSIYVSP